MNEKTTKIYALVRVLNGQRLEIVRLCLDKLDALNHPMNPDIKVFEIDTKEVMFL